MNFVMDVKIFGEFTKIIEDWIKNEIQEHNRNLEIGKDVSQVKEWKKHTINKHLVNRMVV